MTRQTICTYLTVTVKQLREMNSFCVFNIQYSKFNIYIYIDIYICMYIYVELVETVVLLMKIH